MTYPQGPVTVDCDGFEMVVYPQESMLGRVLFDGTTTHDGMRVIEAEFEAAFTDACFDGMTYLDVGANWGYHSLTVHANCDPSRVVAFEPHPDTLDVLRENVDRTDAAVDVVPTAVAAESGTETMWDLGDDADLNTFATDDYAFGDPDVRGEYAVETVALGEFLEDRGIDRVDFLKVDVEGAEGAVLDGVDPCWDRIDGLGIEVHPLRMADFGDRPRDLVERIVDEDSFDVWHFDNDGTVDRLVGDVGDWVDGRFAVRDAALHVLVALRRGTTFYERFSDALSGSDG